MSKGDSKRMDDKLVSVLEKHIGIIYKYHDKFLIENSVPDTSVLLLSIYFIDECNKKTGAKYSNCKNLFVNLGRKEGNFRKILYRIKDKLISIDDEKRIYLKMEGLERVRELLGDIGKSKVHLIKSGQNFSAIVLFENFLKEEIQQGELLLCDSHISEETLYPFSVLKGKITSLRILTANVHNETKFLSYKKKIVKELNCPINVKENKKIHDRYIINKKNCWSLGASIKDLGNKDTKINKIENVYKALKDLFEERWAEV